LVSRFFAKFASRDVQVGGVRWTGALGDGYFGENHGNFHAGIEREIVYSLW